MGDHLTNTQIVDSVSESNAQNLGHGPALAQVMLDTLAVQTTGLMMNQAVNTQQQARTSSSAALTAACSKMLKASPQPEPVIKPPRGPVSPLDTPVDRHYREARNTIDHLNQTLTNAKENSQQARRSLRNIANLTKADIRNGI